MSTNLACLALRLAGPLQSWGSESQFNRRNTGRFPSKSALCGLLCAACGYPRGSRDEAALLERLAKSRLTSIAVSCGKRPVRLMVDYHTVQGTLTADRTLKDTHLTYRQYLNDAYFLSLFEGDAALMTQLAGALEDPVWGVWLGRKACAPTAPVLGGVFVDRGAAVAALVGDGFRLADFARQVDVDTFHAGQDSLRDQASSFDSASREFQMRRVAVFEAGQAGG